MGVESVWIRNEKEEGNRQTRMCIVEERVIDCKRRGMDGGEEEKIGDFPRAGVVFRPPKSGNEQTSLQWEITSGLIFKR